MQAHPAPFGGDGGVPGGLPIRNFNIPMAQQNGIESMAPITGMPGLRQTNSAPGTMPPIVNLGKPTLTMENIDVTCGSFHDNLQNSIAEKMFLLAKESQLYVNDDALPLYTFPHANANFQLSAQNAVLSKKRALLKAAGVTTPAPVRDWGNVDEDNIGDGNLYIGDGRKRSFAAANKRDDFPLTPREFLHQFGTILGAVWQKGQAAPVDHPSFSVTRRGRVEVPNLFSTDLKKGQFVGFIVKRFREQPFSSFVNARGERQGDSIDSGYIQIRGHACENGLFPLSTGEDPDDPQDDNLDAWNPDCEIQMRTVGYKKVTNPATGAEEEDRRFLNWDNVANGRGQRRIKPIKFTDWEQGVWLPIGYVTEVGAMPDKQQILAAHRSLPEYQALWNDYKCTIELNTLHKRQFWFLPAMDKDRS